MLVCLFLCALPMALPAIVHAAMVAALAFGIGSASDAIEFAPYVAPARPVIRMPSPPCRAVVVRTEARAYPVPVIRAPRSASGRFGRVTYSGANN